MSKLVLFSSLGSRLPIVASIAAHAFVLVAAGGSRMLTSPAAAVTEVTIDVDAFVPPPVVEESLPATELHAPVVDVSRMLSTHAHPSAPPARRAEPSAERTIDPREVPAEPAPASVTSDPALPRFSIVLGPVAGDGSARVSGAVGGEGSIATGVGVADEAAMDERGVSVPARLTSSGRPEYPSEARDAGIEADVPLEIVVDRSGRVVDAKLLAHAGHGFDESALRAIRTYRFTPAARDGAPVRVRMRWMVAFRLE